MRLDDPSHLGGHGRAQFVFGKVIETGRSTQEGFEQPPTELQRSGIRDRQPCAAVIGVARADHLEQFGHAGKLRLQLPHRISVEQRAGEHLQYAGPARVLLSAAGAPACRIAVVVMLRLSSTAPTSWSFVPK